MSRHAASPQIYREMHAAENKACRHTLARVAAATATLFACAAWCPAALADVFELANGGRVEGKLLQSDDKSKLNCVIELAAGGKITVARSQITKIEFVNDTAAEYQRLARTSPDTVEAHLKLAEWCRDHKLGDERRQHLERILELSPNHAETRAALGYQQKNGQWMNRDDLMSARGLVRYDGKYMAPQQVELLKQQKDSRTTQADWSKRIDQLRRDITGKRADRVAKAEADIRAIQDPQAADAIVTAIRREKVRPLKLLWIEVAARLNNHVATDALVNLSLTDPDDDIRHTCLDHLIRARRTGLATPYIRTLKDDKNEMVNRAGVALGQIRDRESLGALIDALITKHKVKVSDKNPDQHSYTFSPDGGSFSFGGGGPKFVTESFRNRAVLDAILTMSDNVNFEYDQTQWKAWLAAQSKVTAVDVRRDP